MLVSSIKDRFAARNAGKSSTAPGSAWFPLYRTPSISSISPLNLLRRDSDKVVSWGKIHLGIMNDRVLVCPLIRARAIMEADA